MIKKPIINQEIIFYSILVYFKPLNVDYFKLQNFGCQNLGFSIGLQNSNPPAGPKPEAVLNCRPQPTPLKLYDYMELETDIWHALSACAKFFIFETNFEVGQLLGARACFWRKRLSKNGQFLKNYLISRCYVARAWWRAPQIFYVRAPTTFFHFQENFWRARARARTFIQKNHVATPPYQKNPIF